MWDSVDCGYFFVVEAVSCVVTGWRIARGLVRLVSRRGVSKEEESDDGALRKTVVS